MYETLLTAKAEQRDNVQIQTEIQNAMHYKNFEYKVWRI